MPPQIAAARPPSAARGMPTFKAAGSGARVSGQAAFKPPQPQAPGQRQKGKRPQEQINIDEEVVDLDDDDDDNDAADTSRRRGKRRQGSGAADILAASDNIDEDEAGNNKNDNDNDNDDDDDTDSSGAPPIPPELLTRLLHHFFSKPNSRITQDANTSVGKYMEIFVREAVARSVAERRDGGFLDVDVLQKVAAQLIMDM